MIKNVQWNKILEMYSACICRMNVWYLIKEIVSVGMTSIV